MCSPTTALAVGTQALGFMGQRSQAAAQARAQAIASQQERIRAGEEMSSIRYRQGQKRDALALELAEGQRRAEVSAATAVVSSAEAGISGRAAELAKMSVETQHARYEQSLQKQKAENDFASQLQVESAERKTQMNQIRINQPIKQPSLLEFGAGLAGSMIGAQMQNTQFKMATGQDPTLGNIFQSPLSVLGFGGGGGVTQQQAAPALQTTNMVSPMSIGMPSYDANDITGVTDYSRTVLPPL